MANTQKFKGVPEGVQIKIPEGSKPVLYQGVPEGVQINIPGEPGATPDPMPKRIPNEGETPPPDINRPKTYFERVYADMQKRSQKAMNIMERSMTDPKYEGGPMTGHIPRVGAVALGILNATGQGLMALTADPIAEVFVSGWDVLAPEEFKKFLSEDVPEFLLNQTAEGVMSIQQSLGLSPESMTPAQAKKYKEFVKSDIGNMAIDALSKGFKSWEKFNKRFPEIGETLESILGFQTLNISKSLAKEASLSLSDAASLARKTTTQTKRSLRDLIPGASEEYIAKQNKILSDSIRENIPKVINLKGKGKQTFNQKMRYLDKAEGAVQDIVFNKDNIVLRDLQGNILPHKLPTNTDTAFLDMIQSIDQTKKSLWPQVESALEAADKTGKMVNMDGVIQEIASFIESPSIVSRPDARALREAGHKMLDYYATLKEAQPSFVYNNIIKDRNNLMREMGTFLQPSIADTEKAGLFAAELRGLNTSFKEILDESGNEALRRYGNLLTIQGDFESLVSTAASGSGVDYATVFTALEAAKLATTGKHNPSTLGVTRTIQKIFMNLPEQNITKMFKTADKVINTKIAPVKGVNPKSKIGKTFAEKLEIFDSLF